MSLKKQVCFNLGFKNFIFHFLNHATMSIVFAVWETLIVLLNPKYVRKSKVVLLSFFSCRKRSFYCIRHYMPFTLFFNVQVQYMGLED